MSHKKLSIKIENLLINLENPRFDPVSDQKTAISIMLETMESKMKELAKDIARNGINPTEPLYVIKKDNTKQYIILDGNRRLTAITLINKPNIIPLESKTKLFFQNLKNTGKSLPKTIDCIVFQKKEDANHWIELKHTGENQGAGQVSWDAKQTARFKSQKKDSSRPYIWVVDFMEKNGIHLELGNATNFERIITTAYVKKKTGLNFKNNKLVFTKEKQSVLKNLQKIVNEINKRDFNVGKIYDAKKREKWIDKVLIEEPQPTVVQTRRGGKIVNIQPLPIKRVALISRDFIIDIPQERINLIFDELKKLKVDTYRNAVAVLFRVFLELSVDHFIKNKLSIKKELSQEIKKNARKANKPTLSKKIKVVSDYMEKKQILDKNELQPIRIAISNKYHIFSTHTFNSYVHNLDHIPTSIDLKVSWDSMQKFIQKLWE